jgi:16S rRNA (cytosine967-C5)-methyltransferase
VRTARAVALRVVRRVFEEGAFADQALHAEARALPDARERAFARTLAAGTVQRVRTLDHVASRLTTGRRSAQLDPPIRAALRLGLFQVLLLDGVPDHAAVAETVELVKRERGAGLVNAVLRRATREGAGLLAAIDDEAVLHSVPDWIADLWRDAYGPATASALMARANEPPELALRANRLRTTPAELAAALGPAARPAGEDAVVVDGPFDAHGHPLWHAGHFTPQSRASQRVAPALGAQPDERVLDLCAAPGGKSTHLAALTADRAAITSVEQHAGRAAALQRTCVRVGATSVTVAVADAAQPRDDGPYDRVLADPPCSGLGTLQARPDLRWRMTPERVAGLLDEQRRILAAAAHATAPGGTLVWSTCTLNPAENEALVAELEGFDAEPTETLHPHETGSAGFTVTRLQRRPTRPVRSTA